MKKFFGIVFIIVGIVCLPKTISPSVPETIGGLIGLLLSCALPAYLLLRNNEKKDKSNESDNK